MKRKLQLVVKNIKRDYKIFIKRNYIIKTFLNGERMMNKIILSILRIKNKKVWKISKTY